jgi:hypothetical protein
LQIWISTFRSLMIFILWRFTDLLYFLNKTYLHRFSNMWDKASDVKTIEQKNGHLDISIHQHLTSRKLEDWPLPLERTYVAT